MQNIKMSCDLDRAFIDMKIASVFSSSNASLKYKIQPLIIKNNETF